MATWRRDKNGIHRLNLGGYELTLGNRHVDYPNGIWVIHLKPGLINAEPIGKIDTVTDAKVKAIEIAKGKLRMQWRR